MQYGRWQLCLRLWLGFWQNVKRDWSSIGRAENTSSTWSQELVEGHSAVFCSFNMKLVSMRIVSVSKPTVNFSYLNTVKIVQNAFCGYSYTYFLKILVTDLSDSNQFEFRNRNVFFSPAKQKVKIWWYLLNFYAFSKNRIQNLKLYLFSL